MITVNDWESQKIAVPNDYYKPIYKSVQKYPFTNLAITKNVLVGFIGKNHGATLERKFEEILEGE